MPRTLLGTVFGSGVGPVTVTIPGVTVPAGSTLCVSAGNNDGSTRVVTCTFGGVAVPLESFKGTPTSQPTARLFSKQVPAAGPDEVGDISVRVATTNPATKLWVTAWTE